MKKLRTIPVCLALAATICFAGCTKNDSKFYKDGEADGLTIFSNTENNVMSCYINGEPWHTVPRITTIFISSSTDYEVTIYRTPFNNVLEEVQIYWSGYFEKDRNARGSISLQLRIPRNSFQRYFNSLPGKRMAIDSSAGNYFTAATGQVSLNYKKGNGNIYFHTLQIDSIASGLYSGKMSGLFEANFGAGTITKGRFDHALTQEQIR